MSETSVKVTSPFSSIRVQDLQEDDRPREKALRHGIKALSNAELLAIVLGGGLPGMSVLDMSRDILLKTDNSLINLSRAEIGEMKRKFKGVGTAKAILVSAVFELGRRWRDEMADAESRRPTQVRSSEDAYRFIRGRVELLPHEEFWVLMLSRSNIITEARCISQGGTAATVVDAKLLFRHAIDSLASSIILVHNHPSGNLKPSMEDDNLTRRLGEAGKLLDIRVIDHLIVTRDGYYSYADQSRL
ncbi:MAG: DNA repair protein RadC [Bacteroides sp.]|nr:DNA repair protein RadC [Bacteroidales bacterium]MBD5317558.1 DNA repair protein RadC [Bacteroides sp.]